MKIHDSLGYQLNLCAKLIKRKMDKRIEQFSLTTTQWAVLSLLNEKGMLSQAQISDELQSDRATVGNVIFTLIDKSYIEKEIDKKDRRSYQVDITDLAKNIINEIEEHSNQLINHALTDFTETEKNIFFSNLNKIIINLSKE